MKINNLPDKPAGAATGAGKPVDRLGEAATQRSEASAEAAGVTVRSGGDVFNAQKVEAVKMAIANGSFSINAEAIADKLLSNARDMLGVASK